MLDKDTIPLEFAHGHWIALSVSSREAMESSLHHCTGRASCLRRSRNSMKTFPLGCRRTGTQISWTSTSNRGCSCKRGSSCFSSLSQICVEPCHVNEQYKFYLITERGSKNHGWLYQSTGNTAFVRTDQGLFWISRSTNDSRKPTQTIAIPKMDSGGKFVVCTSSSDKRISTTILKLPYCVETVILIQ